MTNQDVAGALQARDLMHRIATDPDLDHNTKLFAFCLQAVLTDRRRAGRRANRWAIDVGTMMYPPDSPEQRTLGPLSIVRRVIANDAPRYEIPAPDEPLRCEVPKTRGPLAGRPCGKAPTGRALPDHDPDTGHGRLIGYCRNHSHPQLDEWRLARYRQWQANSCPTPPPNTGGVLARYFDTDWDNLYRWAEPRWESPAGQPRSSRRRPHLSVIDGGRAGGRVERSAGLRVYDGGRVS